MINKIACDKRKEICGFWPGIVPLDPAFALCTWIAIGQKDRQLAFNPYGKASHNIGAVWIKGNLAKALGFALGAIHAARHVKAFKCGVGFWADFHLGFPNERCVGNVNREPPVFYFWRAFLAINFGADQMHVFAVQHKTLLIAVRIRAKRNPAEDTGLRWMQAKSQLNVIY